MGLLSQVLNGVFGSRSSGDSDADASKGTPALVSAIEALLGSEAANSSGLASGLNGLIEKFRQSGHGDIIDSWLRKGSNLPIEPNQLNKVLGADTVDDLAAESGLPRQDLLTQLAQVLPSIVDRLSPNGRAPRQEEMDEQGRETEENEEQDDDENDEDRRTPMKGRRDEEREKGDKEEEDDKEEENDENEEDDDDDDRTKKRGRE